MWGSHRLTKIGILALELALAADTFSLVRPDTGGGGAGCDGGSAT
jgi:hypothetical protein